MLAFMQRWLTQANSIGIHDLIIAATAISHGCTLLTANIAEFRRVPSRR